MPGKNNITDDEERRKQEMSMFAAFATGGETSVVGANVDALSSNPFDRSSFRVEPETSEPTTRQTPEPLRPGNDNSSVLEVACGEGTVLQDSGSFTIQNTSSKTKNRVGAAEQSNLSAAVAALSKESASGPALKSAVTSLKLLPGAGNRTIHHNVDAPKHFRNNREAASKSTKDNRNKDPLSIPEDQIPMFAEEVVMPRPLFFGAVVPPRVLQAARTMVQSAVRETGSQHPRLHELPFSVRNLVGTLQTYGYGLHDLLEPLASFAAVDNSTRHASFADDDSNSDTMDVHYRTTGDPNVTTFQPVWGSDIRAKRVREYCTQRAARNIRKPTMVSRVSTAPPRMLLSTDDDDDDDDDSDNEDIDIGYDHVHDQPVDTTGYRAAAGQKFRNALERFEEPQDKVQPKQAMLGKSSPPTKEQKSSSLHTSEPLVDKEQFSAWIRNDNDDDNSLTGVESLSFADGESRAPDLSEQEKFSQWALGSASEFLNGSGTRIGPKKSTFNKVASKRSTDTFQFTTSSERSNVNNAFSTFQRLPSAVDSDDDSLIDDEQKKQVGVNESLSKAVALLAEQDDEETAAANADPGVENSLLLSQVPQDWTRRRPLTNYELTSGCVPLFGIDDSPLPQESDLGIHETKEEVQRAMEQKRSQEIIDKFVPRNFFGPVACPNPAINPDDFHSWNSRATTSSSPSTHNTTRFTTGSSMTSDPVGINRRAQHGTAGSDPLGRNTNTPSNNNGPPPKPPKHKPSSVGKESSTAPMKKVLPTNRQRFGWWSQGPPTDHDNSNAQQQRPKELSTPGDEGATGQKDVIEESVEHELQLPPNQNSAAKLQVATPLEPTMEQLRNDNLPLSRMHAATTMAQALPYLSDRPPSYRYLQIDTQLITFPPIRAEIEPFFCSLSLYNVETVSSGISTGSSKNSAPIPDMQRCGRVTEALYFDHVQDPEVEKRCEGALWPYSKIKGVEPGSGWKDAEADPKDSSDVRRWLRGTKCGVFPIPSNLNVANLYAVLIVHKVVSDASDLDPYLKPGKPISDLERLKYNAAKNAAKHGSFVVPFAFGVAPLLQVFGTDNPIVATSRAVQIPLFHFSDGERQIIDHIMVMLFPRADHRENGIGGPAPVTNGGSAMLIMRNFGYLGLHTVVDSKSSLARDRLVDFTGELQLRRRTEEDMNVEDKLSARRTTFEPENYRLKLPNWQPKFVAEPTINGGRVLVGSVKSVEPSRVNDSKHYAQELAPLALMLAPTDRLTDSTQSGMPHNGPQQDDIEPLYHTSFCNELLCHPRILHNSPRGTVAIKVELRDVQWNENLNAYFAHLPGPAIGPSIHNNRRGPFLVQSAFTSCSPRRSEHQFLDEFKLKLPLDLQQEDDDGRNQNLCLFFTVCRLHRGSKSMWKRGAKMIFGSNSGGTSDAKDAEDGLRRSRVDEVVSGFLPITAQSCLIDNGLYDVRIVYKARAPSRDESIQWDLPVTSLILETSIAGDVAFNAAGRDDSIAEDTTISNESVKSDRNRAATIVEKADSDSDSISKGGNMKTSEPISLSVRVVVYSSLHTQNAVLNQLLNQESDLPVMSYLPNKVFIATLRMGREYLAGNASFIPSRRIAHAREFAMVEPTIAITDHQVCSVPQLTGHMLRILPALWRSLVRGDGDPDLVWANPGASTPLRVQSFATILHLVGATALYMSRNGVTQVNGTSKWNVVIFSRVLALLFDEKHLFGGQSVEKFDEKYLLDLAEKSGSNSHPAKKSQPKRRGHVRSTYDLGNDIGPSKGQSSIVSHISSNAGDLVTLPKREQPEPENFLAAFEIDMRGSDDSDEQHSPNTPTKVDTKSDFQSFLRAANASFDDDLDKVSVNTGKRNVNSSANASANSFAKAFSGISTGGKFSTAPPLHTILEGGNDSSSNLVGLDDLLCSSGMIDAAFDARNDGIVSSFPTQSTKKMRVPQLRKTGSLNMDIEKPLAIDKQNDSEPIIPKVPKSSEEIEELGEGFLDSIGARLGLSNTLPDPNGEEGRVGSSHHRSKTRGRSSIDWSLLPGLDEKTATTNASSQDDVTISSEGATDESDEHLSTLKSEESACMKLPTFVDRLVIIGDSSPVDARWFPYTYEVIIMQWAAVLFEQRKVGERKPASISTDDQSTGQSSHSQYSNGSLSHAALRCVGVAVAGAPLLFEVIKKSLGFRVKKLFDRILSKSEIRSTPPLVSLDEVLLTNLVQVVSMVTDACIDFRNFDTWDLRQMSIDVNDAIVRFLRDMFSFLAPTCVHRLILAYLSRFVTKEGKYSTDRDSLIGLRCSWEITKLRLNAVTALIRFPDFIKVNGPQMLNWSNWWINTRSRSNPKFYDNVLHRYENFRLPDFVTNEVGFRKDILVASMRPHWLVEVVVDICLLGTEHAEQYIHHRSASLLHELFWACSQESTLYGISAPVGAMFATYLEKLILHASYLSNFAPKNQLRKDVLSPSVFVLQSAPPDLLRALWRKLFSRLPGKGFNRKYAIVMESFGYDSGDESPEDMNSHIEARDEPDIIGMISLLNLTLRTIEYEGSDENLDSESSGDSRNNLDLWRKEFLISRPPVDARQNRGQEALSDDEGRTSTSRKWQAHDGSMAIISAAHQIVREVYMMLNKSQSGKALLNPAVRGYRPADHHDGPRSRVAAESAEIASLSRADIVLFIRAITSLYLHALALRESDIVIAKSFLFSADVIKIFGIKLFLEGVGETHQHWMRVISFHCGARRAHVRIEATDLLELVLRSTWECYGSFFRIRLPLLAVQTEVMERIVATAAARYYRDQRRLGITNFENFTNVGAEASLVPLWRTLDRIQKQPASQNVAFRGALIRLAGKLKKLYRAYVAARVLSFIKSYRNRSPAEENPEERDFESEALVRANRISILRVINASENHSKQFLGFQGTTLQRSNVAHYEAVEDALIDAGNVFSPTELPEHRVAWLRMLAEFHKSRNKFAEEATCHYQIHLTLHLAARLHGSLWSNTPFLPWTDNIPDPVVYIDADASPGTDPDYQESELNFDGDDWEYSGQAESAISFRRIFYRVANSITMGNAEYEVGGSKSLFYGVTFLSEYLTVSPWVSLREMEENMVEEVETAGSLFLKAGIVESSRYSWNLATQYYAEKFNYAKLQDAYSNLAETMVSQVPFVDTSLPQEVSTILGRFYRVWFHGGAPDELSGVEFVYRTQGNVRLHEFGEELRTVIQTIVPNKTPIHLIMDGYSDERVDDSSANYSGFRIGPAPLEPVHIKVTPLCPRFDSDIKTRGLPEWFNKYADEAFSGQIHLPKNDFTENGKQMRKRSIMSTATGGAGDPGARVMMTHEHSRSFAATIFSSGGSSAARAVRKSVRQTVNDADRLSRFNAPQEPELSGVDKFCFVQPKNRSRPKEWWKASTGDFAEKSLRVTQLQVAESFPACVSRQEVVHRLVYLQSPLEAGIDAMCQWCAVLFRTAVATSGMHVLKTNHDPGIGTDAAKVVADCIHNSHVKDFGLNLLRKHSENEADHISDFAMDSGQLADDEIAKLQIKLARLIIIFVEVLHLLIARNRDKLLNVIKERKRHEASGSVQGGASTVCVPAPVPPSRGNVRHMSVGNYYENSGGGRKGSAPSVSETNRPRRGFSGDNRSDTIRSDDLRGFRSQHTYAGSEDNQSYHSIMTTSGARTDSAIAVQSELQRAFISLCKVLYKSVQSVMREETPRWFKQSGQDNYFSLGTYKQTVIPIAEELCFNAIDSSDSDSQHPFHQQQSHSVYSEPGYDASPRGGSVTGGSQGSIVSRGSDRYGFGQF